MTKGVKKEGEEWGCKKDDIDYVDDCSNDGGG